jgi:hypothetical protein
MRSGGRSAPLEINRPIQVVEGDALPGILPSPWITDFKCPVDSVVLGRKAITIDYRPLDSTDLPNECEPSKSLLVLLEFIVG